MKANTKILLTIGLIAIVSGGIFASIKYSQRGIVNVQTGRVVRQDLVASVTASGEIKPKNYINLGANTVGPAPITAILVKEGDHVRKGEVVAKMESVQANADVVAQKASIDTSLADSAAAEAELKSMADGVTTAEATLQKNQAELDRTKANFTRATELYKAKLLAKQDFDQKKAEYDTAIAAMRQATAGVAQAKAQEAQARQQLASAQKRIAQLQANLARYKDILAKYDVVSPIDGMVTDLPVRTGETVVPGIQNSAASTIMTIADMSQITAEVKVDETDIVSVAVGQPAQVTIDAMPNKTFHGHVTEIGDTAILRSSGVAASQSNTADQEAKDFKVVIALDDPPADIRPGLSCTGKIITATHHNVLTVPIQALTVRKRGDLTPNNPNTVQAAAYVSPAQERKNNEELQGVFVIRNGKAQFVQVNTGITGDTDIEVLSGLKEGDQIITGSYKVIRTLRNFAKVKVDNSLLAPTTES